MNSYGPRIDRGVGTGELVTLAVLGVAAGALAAWLLTTTSREKAPLGRFSGQINPREWLAKAAQTLQEGRDRIINAVEERQNS